MSRNLVRVIWQVAILLVAAAGSLVLGDLVRPWIGIVTVATVAAIVAIVPEIRDARRLRAIRDRAERTADTLGGTIVRRAGDEIDGLSAAVSGVIKAAEKTNEDMVSLSSDRDVVLSTVNEGVVILDASGTLYLINHAASRMLGVRESPTKAPGTLRRLARDAASGPALITEVFEHGRPTRWLYAVVKPIDNGRALIILDDVTANKQASTMMRDFVADASHELKTPVAALIAASETIVSALPDEPDAAAAFAERLNAEALRLAALVSDLLDLSRLEAARPAMETVGLAPIVEAEVENRRDSFDGSGIALATDIADVKVKANAREIALAVGNLLENARLYSESGSTVRVSVTLEEGRALVTVADEGSGIPARDIARIFDRFYRVDTARSRRSGGTGLGLAIVKHIVDRHGGGVEVESELGVGSTFRFWIPKA
jgi:signal transduction histidine kinase